MTALDTSLQSRTRRHYDEHPFDAITREEERQPQRMQTKPFLAFCERYLDAQSSVLEIGCGPGRIVAYLTANGMKDVTAIDISATAVARARQRAPKARLLRATAMLLPFGDARFDVVVSEGVIHHTPEPRVAFAEAVRVLRRGGYFYLGVYNRRRHYYYIYTYVGPPIRWLARSTAGRAMLTATLIPLYYAVHLAKSRGKRTWQGACNFFYDYIVTPQAAFYTREEIVRWGTEAGLDVLRYDPSLGNVHIFVFRKSSG